MANGDVTPGIPNGVDTTTLAVKDPFLTGYWWIDIIREISRGIIGLGVTAGGLYLLWAFVVMSPPDERTQIMLLIIGFLGGFMTGIATWYFGGAMRSASRAAVHEINRPEGR